MWHLKLHTLHSQCFDLHNPGVEFSFEYMNEYMMHVTRNGVSSDLETPRHAS
jgi:hypothetical protein